MYTYRRRGRVGSGSIFFTVLFTLTTIGLGCLLYLDKGRFWDLLPLVSIIIIVASLILAVFNFIKRTAISYIFVLFFITFLSGLILSSIFGPFAAYNEAKKNFDAAQYHESIDKFKIILDDYPNSKHADDALENISFAYYYDGSYKKAILYFGKAIEQNIIQPSDFEIKNIFAECYLKLAENYYNEKKYTESAENYLNAIEILSDIIINFPDTNEAFISTYKIPEYLYNIAKCYRYNNNLDSAIETLTNIINNYPESKCTADADLLLFSTYFDKSMELKNSYKHKESVEEFLKILDLEYQNNYDYMLNYYKEKIFSDVPPDILNNTAKSMYQQCEYEKALFVCNAAVDYNPELEEEFTQCIVNCKIKIITSSNHDEIKQPKPARKIYSPEMSRLVIENNAGFDLTVYFGGPEYRIEKLEPDSKIEIEIKAGKYSIAAELETSEVIPYLGIITYEENKKYLQPFSSVTN
jgi:tetratricopeptide (TPR) repeat protein